MCYTDHVVRRGGGGSADLPEGPLGPVGMPKRATEAFARFDWSDRALRTVAHEDFHGDIVVRC